MALLTRSASANMDTSTGMFAVHTSALIAGEALDAVAACYIKTSDGKVYMTNATADNEASEFVGFTPRAVKAGEPVALFSLGARFRYGTSLGPGDVYYAAATAGRLDTAPTAGGRTAIARAVSDTDIQCIAAWSTSVNT